ncbi:MAG: hypothetical protein RLP02_00850, partial [Coleofasciculus sp. C2-GNP5-27]
DLLTKLFQSDQSASGRIGAIGGILGYPLDRLYQEVALIAFYFHWSLDDILNLEHEERLRWDT